MAVVSGWAMVGEWAMGLAEAWVRDWESASGRQMAAASGRVTAAKSGPAIDGVQCQKLS